MESIWAALAGIDWGNFIQNVLAILGVFSVIAKFTPWEGDNKAIDAIIKFILALGMTKKK